MILSIVMGVAMTPFFLWVLSEIVKEEKRKLTKTKKDWYTHE